MAVRTYKIPLQQFQSNRLRRDHADLAAEPQYQLIANFFFDEMYGPRDFSARDQQARRLNQFVHFAPGLNIGDVEQVLDLLEVSDRLDDNLCVWLQAMDAPADFDEETYEQAYRLADNYEERQHQLELVRIALYNVYKLTDKPLIKLALDRTEKVAHAVGMGDIHRFLRLGHKAIQPVRDINRFVETIYDREKIRLERIYADYIDRLNVER